MIQGPGREQKPALLLTVPARGKEVYGHLGLPLSICLQQLVGAVGKDGMNV